MAAPTDAQQVLGRRSKTGDVRARDRSLEGQWRKVVGWGGCRGATDLGTPGVRRNKRSLEVQGADRGDYYCAKPCQHAECRREASQCEGGCVQYTWAARGLICGWVGGCKSRGGVGLS